MRFFSSLTPQQAFLTTFLLASAHALPTTSRDKNLEGSIKTEARNDSLEGALEDRAWFEQAGYLNIINGTPYRWKRTGFDEYQVHGSWKEGFEAVPEVRELGGNARMQIRFDTAPGVTESDTSAWATYEMEGCTTPEGNICTFSVLARGFGHGSGKFEIMGRIDNFGAIGYASGSTIELGWTENHDCAWIISGDITQGFGTSRPPVDWMKQNLASIGNRKLKDICMPGSHDSGMSIKTSETLVSFEDNTLTQWHSIYDQMMSGARYFDIRPVISGGEFRLGHYSKIVDMTWQGMTGQKMNDVIAQVNDFTEDYGDLIILNFSHDLNTDIGNMDYDSIDQGWWERLLGELTNPDTGLKRIYVTDSTDPKAINFANEPLNKFISGGQGAVLIILDPGRGIGAEDGKINIDAFVPKGVYARSQYDPVDLYTGGRDREAVVTDQINKMNNNRDVNRPFLLSWTITFSDATDNIPLINVLREEADDMNDLIWSRLPPAVNANVWPSILYMDSIGGEDGFTKNTYAALAMAINFIARPFI